MNKKLARGIPAGLLSIVLAVTTVGAAPAPAPSVLHAGDRAALVALYNATDGPNWVNNTNWLTDRPMGAWYGVTTNDGGRVTGLDLHDNELRGQIPPELGRLDRLSHLFLRGNGTVTCPLDNASFREWLKGIRNKRGLFCSHAGDRAALVALYRATGGLAWRDNSRWLTDWHLDTWFGVTTDDRGRVTELDLNSNNLSGEMPPQLGSLSNLTHMDLRSNGLRGQIPPELGDLDDLEVLSLSGNALSGKIPPELGALPNLTLLHISGNALSGQIPPELGSLSNLRLLHLNGNALSGQIPPELGSLINLRHLFLNGNDLSGQIPPELGSLSNLVDLHLGGNKLSGQMPPELSRLYRVTQLVLSDNALSGQIPPELAKLSHLNLLNLSNNDLSGQMPPELSRLDRLSHLFLQGNGIITCPLDNAAFREWLKGIRNRRGLCSHAGDRAALVALYRATGGRYWRDNSRWLTDLPLDAWFGVTTDDRGRVTELDLNSNNLSGKMPPQLGSLSNLTHLDLRSNGLRGQIPRELGDLDDLEVLSLSGNALGGKIPPELGSLSNLTHLDLRSNSLGGQIPPELGALSRVKKLVLGDNELIGYIPPELSGLSNVEELFLNGNELSGPIPSELGDLKNLEVISLDGNRLIGEDWFHRVPGNPWGNPWHWHFGWLSVGYTVDRLVIMPLLVLGLFVFVDPPGARRAWDRRGERFGRQRSPRGLPLA